jgi:hypothetical protein
MTSDIGDSDTKKIQTADSKEADVADVFEFPSPNRHPQHSGEPRKSVRGWRFV